MTRATRNWWRHVATLALGLSIINGGDAYAQPKLPKAKSPFPAPKFEAPKVNVPKPSIPKPPPVNVPKPSIPKPPPVNVPKPSIPKPTIPKPSVNVPKPDFNFGDALKQINAQRPTATPPFRPNGAGLQNVIQQTRPPSVSTPKPEFNPRDALRQVNVQRPPTTPPFRPNGAGLQNVIQQTRPQLPGGLPSVGNPQRVLPTNVPKVSGGVLKSLPGKLPGGKQNLPAGLPTNLVNSAPVTRPASGIPKLSGLRRPAGSMGNLQPLVQTIVTQPGKDLQTLGGILNAPLETTLGRSQSEQDQSQDQIRIVDSSTTIESPQQEDADVETDNHVTTKVVVVQEPDRRIEALNLASFIVGLVQAAVSSSTPQDTTGDVAVADPGTEIVSVNPGVISEETAVVDPATEMPAEYTYLIVNLTEQPLTYAVRQGRSAWGSFTVAAGKKHKYVIPHEEMEVQFAQGGQPTTMTVPGDQTYAFAQDEGQVGFFLADEE
jgi:hypothetical protein